MSGVESEQRKRAFALWCLVSLRENDDFSGIPDAVREAALAAQQQLRDSGHDVDLEVAQARYRHIDAQIDRFLHKAPPRANEVTAKIDAVLTHPVAGLLIFILVMSVVFTAIFDWVAPIMDAIDAGFLAAATWVTATMPVGLLGDLLGNGVIKGVGSVVVFLPQIVVLFFFLTLLEGCGYMSRAAFMMDRLMRKIGLQGKAFVPLVSGYACAIPAVLATRTLESHRDRLLTMMVIPLVSCSARLPVYTLIIGALFPAERKVFGPLSLGTVMMLTLYLLSMVLALVAAAVLGRVLLKGKRHALLIELPPYRLPHARTLALVLWQKAWVFLRTAGTVIVAVSLILWTLLALPQEASYSRDYDRAIATASSEGNGQLVQQLRGARQAEKLHQSYAGRLGRLIEPLLAPLGFDWKITIGLIGSFAAREVFVATMGLVYGVGGDAEAESVSLREAIRSERRADGSMVYTPLTGLSLLVFFLFAMQCMSTLAVVRQESGSWRWSLLMLAYLTALAYLASLLVYQGGKLLGY
jgi:ferrous iron transport protein B